MLADKFPAYKRKSHATHKLRLKNVSMLLAEFSIKLSCLSKTIIKVKNEVIVIRKNTDKSNLPIMNIPTHKHTYTHIICM